MKENEKWNVIRSIRAALELFEQSYLEYIPEDERPENGAKYRAMTHGDHKIVGNMNQAIKLLKDSIENPEEIPNYSDAELKQRYLNAYTTHCQAGGHTKAAMNEGAMRKWQQLIEDRGLKVPTPEERKGKGTFNGKGSV
jgi:hypothetical protein